MQPHIKKTNQTIRNKDETNVYISQNPKSNVKENYSTRKGYRNGPDNINRNNLPQRRNDSFQNRNTIYHTSEIGGNQTNFKTSASQRTTRKKFLGFKKLEEMYQMDPEMIIIQLQDADLETVLSSNLSPDFIVLIIKILAKVSSSTFIHNKFAVVNLISSEKFLNSLFDYVTRLYAQTQQEKRRNQYFWKEPEIFFNNLFVTCNMLIDIAPSMACDKLEKIIKSYEVTSELLKASNIVTISEETNQKFSDLKLKFDMCVKEQERRKTAMKQESIHDEEPPDDFREISVYPLPEEVISITKPFIRENIVKGPYKNVEHYLDIQFRLLREDFVAPLRKGICDYREFKTTPKPKNAKLKNSSVKIYENVYFLYNKTINDQVGVVIQLTSSFKKQKRKQNFENSRQFMYGSLMCFTKDNFATLIFGKVLERNKELLENDQLVIGFEKEYNSAYEFDKSYTMIESKVYFEPYYHVLAALQDFNPEHFPMKQYFIYVNPDVKPPDYLLPVSGYLTLRNNSVPVLNNPLTWSNLRAQLSEFDDSQFNAFRSALTEEFVVIQGPPGTGKTYLGLKIAEVLLENLELWNIYGRIPENTKMPMLVVCFTNHALDQFLEGLLQFTDKIVRVGGQSKNEKLKNYSLREQKKKVKIGGQFGHALYEKRKDLTNIFAEIKAVNETIDRIIKNDGVLNVNPLWCIDNKIRSSWFEYAKPQEVIDWLFGGRDRQRLDIEEQNNMPPEINEENESKNDDEIDSEEEIYEEIDENIHTDDKDEIEMDFLPNIAHFNMPNYLVNIKTMEEKIKNNECKLIDLRNQGLDVHSYLEEQELQWVYFQAREELKFFKEKLNEGEKTLRQDPKSLKKPRDIDYKTPTNMKSEDRWNLYYFWVTQFLNLLFNRSKKLQQDYSKIYKQYAELKDIENLQLIRTMDVVGMTTTGAARLQTTLQSLKCRVVIVEEAAEVLESHIIVSLTKHCQHLLLIGDHKQLRPSTADFHTETKYKLGISLFERMVVNNMHLNTLKVQHRMRPEIASLIVPAIYPELENHESVLNYPPVMGIDSSLYFINHNEPEGEWGDSSKKNDHEAKYLIQLARYLILNGYKPEDITILAAYSGQMFNLFRERRDYGTVLHDVRITVLDNYQGEECKIILLSLVRNNHEGKIGFLKIENRVCVALSRAKEGFYIMGNMQLLCNNSQIWPNIKGVLEKQKALGSSLTVRCQIHQDQVAHIEKLEDFKKVPEGGCLKMCNALLNCGHICKKCCHLVDRDHETFRCTERCTRILCDNGHQCPKKCFENCGECTVLMKRLLPCLHEELVPCYMDLNEFCCKAQVDTVLPCGHKTVKPCFIDSTKVRCPFPCETRIEPCGHSCRMTCHIGKDPDHLEYKCTKPCSKPKAGCSTGEHPCQQMCFEICKPCEVIVLKKRTKCSHAFGVKCSSNVDDFECRKPCKRELLCGHKCKKSCSEPCGDCHFKVQKMAPCTHMVQVKCYKNPTRLDCKGTCTLLLPCGHPCQQRCNQKCTVSCKVLVKSNKPSDCGHTVDVLCHLRNEDLLSGNFSMTKYCSSPCGERLACGHQCYGTCGNCAQGRIHVTCSEKCEFPLVCGHVCRTPCRASCPPCDQKCTYSCVHSKCPRKCGQPCVDCKEPCPRRCQHLRCENYCGLPCSVPPCTEPCLRRLPCGHNCIGFCGDPCPHLCRICDKEELTSFILMGNEEDDNARFVELLDCGHVIENEGMEMWLETASEKVGVKTCPQCNCPITTTMRYSDYVKKANKIVTAVKEKCVGNRWQNDRKRKQLLNETNNISVVGLNKITQ
ncbi:NFX1-type zinc finger-containing protein 1-like isoform X2 [Agrilus planipennis]|uniref:NFX1-type zinc finger-containing protein 1-like isoform X2 n=1 Tax=Agrilus planipennis TaxID=224129 RepID=A0A7F5RJS9_AGRPL|nr:NFX1-type zinc finger-containing protein 1-like isoform X2 [Agrilus planipennis]